MGAIVTFDYAGWQQACPELANVPSGQASAYFTIATSFQRNDGGGPVNDPSVQLTGLNLLTSHIAVLSGWVPNAKGGVFDGSNVRVVGHVDSATEGSVTIQVAFDTGSAKQPLQAWAIQTSYGATWWAMMQFVRTFRYVGLPCNVPGFPFPPRW